MRRIALLTSLAALALGPASASARTQCADLTFYAHVAYYIHETAMGCHDAHEIVRNVVAHGGSHHEIITCSRHVYSASITGWHCTGHVNGVDVSVSFYLRWLGAYIG